MGLATRMRSSYAITQNASLQTRWKRNVSGLPSTTDLLERYRGLVATGKVEYDEAQVRAVMQLRSLSRSLRDYAPPVTTSYHFRTHPRSIGSNEESTSPWWTPKEGEMANISGLVRVRTHAEELAALNTPKGLMLTGPPGSGKSFLVDLWFSTISTPYKARQHYSEFVLELYRGVWEETQRRMAIVRNQTVPDVKPIPWTRAVRDRWRELVQQGKLPTVWTRSPGIAGTSTDPPISYILARRLIFRHWLLVFDEVQLLDVSSAGLLSETLSWFWRMGGVVVGTSNAVPEDLYKQGTQRERLEPFIEALRARCPVVEVHAAHDWREFRAHKSASKTWFTVDQTHQFEEAVESLLPPGAQPGEAHISVFTRQLQIPWSSQGICKISFDKLCNESLGAADYISLASAYHTVIITDVPVLTLTTKDRARRFITLIDALYERRCHLFCLAHAEPTKLFFPTDMQLAMPEVDSLTAEAFTEGEAKYRPNISAYGESISEDLPIVKPSALSLNDLSIFSGHDEHFAYKRALSRLLEMTSDAYIRENNWTPLPSKERQWESALSSPTITYSSATRDVSAFPENDDFAAEASYNDPVSLSRRPAAPKIRPDHIWGVRDDWGQRAKAWGRGVNTVFTDQNHRSEQ